MGGGPDATVRVGVAGGVGVGGVEGVEVMEAVAVTIWIPRSDQSDVAVGDSFSVVGGPVGRASVGDVAGTVSTVQAVRKSNRDRRRRRPVKCSPGGGVRSS